MAGDKRQLIIEVKAQVDAANAALKKLETDGAAIAGKLGQAFNFNQIIGAVQNVRSTLQPVIDFLNDSLQEAMEAEEFQSRLNALTAESVPLINAYANAMQKRLGIDNDVFVGMAGKIAAYTGLRGEELRMATQLAVQYGGLTGKMEGVERIVNSFIQKGAMRGFAFDLDTSASMADRLTEALAKTEGGMVILEDRMNTAAGKLAAFKTGVDNLKESTGEGLLGSDAGEAAQRMLPVFTELLNESGKFKDAIAGALLGLVDAGGATGNLARLLALIPPEAEKTQASAEDAAEAYKTQADLLGDIEGSTSEIAGKTGEIATNSKKTVDYYGQWLDRVKQIVASDNKHESDMAAAEARRKKWWAEQDAFWAEHDKRMDEQRRKEREGNQRYIDNIHLLVNLYDTLSDAGKRVMQEQFPLIEKWKQFTLDSRPLIEKLTEQYQRLGLVQKENVETAQQATETEDTAVAVAEQRLETERKITQELRQQATIISGFIPFTTPKESAAYAAQAQAAVRGGTSEMLLANLQQQLAQLEFEIAGGKYRGELPSISGGAAGRKSDLEAFIAILQLAQNAFGKAGTPSGTTTDPITVKIVGSSGGSAVA